MLVRSLINIRKTNGPEIESCGTPAWYTCFPIWCLAMSKTLWNLPLEKLVINWNKFPLTPVCFNLNNNPSCQTLSNALDISRNTSQVSRVGLQSKLEKMSWVIASSWFKYTNHPGENPIDSSITHFCHQKTFVEKKFVENKFFKNIFVYRQKRYWLIVWYYLVTILLMDWSNICSFLVGRSASAAGDFWNIRTSGRGTDLV